MADGNPMQPPPGVPQSWNVHTTSDPIAKRSRNGIPIAQFVDYDEGPINSELNTAVTTDNPANVLSSLVRSISQLNVVVNILASTSN